MGFGFDLITKWDKGYTHIKSKELTQCNRHEWQALGNETLSHIFLTVISKGNYLSKADCLSCFLSYCETARSLFLFFKARK